MTEVAEVNPAQDGDSENQLGSPKREKLHFHVPTLIGAPPEVEELVQHIQHVAEQFLYHWKSFPIGKFTMQF